MTWFRERITHHCKKCDKNCTEAYYVPGLPRLGPCCIVKAVQGKRWLKAQGPKAEQWRDEILTDVGRKKGRRR